jgi:hypothetical protein
LREGDADVSDCQGLSEWIGSSLDERQVELDRNMEERTEIEWALRESAEMAAAALDAEEEDEVKQEPEEPNEEEEPYVGKGKGRVLGSKRKSITVNDSPRKRPHVTLSQPSQVNTPSPSPARVYHTPTRVSTPNHRIASFVSGAPATSHSPFPTFIPAGPLVHPPTTRRLHQVPIGPQQSPQASRTLTGENGIASWWMTMLAVDVDRRLYRMDNLMAYGRDDVALSQADAWTAAFPAVRPWARTTWQRHHADWESVPEEVREAWFLKNPTRTWGEFLVENVRNHHNTSQRRRHPTKKQGALPGMISLQVKKEETTPSPQKLIKPTLVLRLRHSPHPTQPPALALRRHPIAPVSRPSASAMPSRATAAATSPTLPRSRTEVIDLCSSSDNPDIIELSSSSDGSVIPLPVRVRSTRQVIRSSSHEDSADSNPRASAKTTEGMLTEEVLDSEAEMQDDEDEILDSEAEMQNDEDKASIHSKIAE